ncbi:Asp/Glu/hydantoin racemase [Coniochaeta sp. 2T2.1]|nr:Asp/Glu/hydantoin racemase [Coniochaeta sp. 2T2.1]
MTLRLLRQSTKILVVNPNSSESMTHGVEEAIRRMRLADNTEIYTYTAPKESPASINTGEDVALSADVVHADLRGKLADYDAVLVACYSVHPLVQRLARDNPHLAVTGIFEASVLATLSLLGPPTEKGEEERMWGVVTTGKFWEQHLSDGVKHFLGQKKEEGNFKFGGVESTGLNAGDFHGGVDPAVIRQKLKEATQRLLSKGSVECVVMGCAGMAGLEDIIRDATREKYGKELAETLFVVDGVLAGVGLLETTVKNRRMFRH